MSCPSSSVGPQAHAAAEALHCGDGGIVMSDDRGVRYNLCVEPPKIEANLTKSHPGE